MDRGAWQAAEHEAVKSQTQLFIPLNSVSLVQVFSHVWLFATPWTVAHQTSLSTTNSWSLLRLMSIESVMPSNHLILCCPRIPLPSVFPSIRIFSNESALHIWWTKYWSFSFSIRPSNEYPGLISFRTDWFDWSLCSPRDSQEPTPAPQLENISSLVLDLLYGPTRTSIHDYWKNHSFDYGPLLARWCLCFLIRCLGFASSIFIYFVGYKL